MRAHAHERAADPSLPPDAALEPGSSAVERFVAVSSGPSLPWQDPPFLRERTRLPIVLKGILHREAAERALDHGIDGIVVSNHGGRLVDGAIATLDALPEILEAVAGRAPCCSTAGSAAAQTPSRRSLGATAVLLGRPSVYGLALAGETGVREVIQTVVGQLDLTLDLAGGSATAELDRSALVRA